MPCWQTANAACASYTLDCLAGKMHALLRVLTAVPALRAPLSLPDAERRDGAPGGQSWETSEQTRQWWGCVSGNLSLIFTPNLSTSSLASPPVRQPERSRRSRVHHPHRRRLPRTSAAPRRLPTGRHCLAYENAGTVCRRPSSIRPAPANHAGRRTRTQESSTLSAALGSPGTRTDLPRPDHQQPSARGTASERTASPDLRTSARASVPHTACGLSPAYVPPTSSVSW